MNEYLRTLLSTCSYELHLEPNRNAYLVAAGGNSDVSTTPLLGTHISAMVFPLIPVNIKLELPNKPEVEFVHKHNLGDFSFLVRKSPAGFMVTVRPVLQGQSSEVRDSASRPVPPAPTMNQAPSIPAANSFRTPTAERAAPLSPPYFNQTAEAGPTITSTTGPEIEVISANDPQFLTAFSDTSTYEPPGRRSDYDFESGPGTPVTAAAPPAFDAYETEIDFDSVAVSPSPSPVAETFSARPVLSESIATSTPMIENHNIPLNQTAFTTQAIHEFDEPEQPAPFRPVAVDSSARARMDALFHAMAEIGASDLHLAVSMPPMVRKDGKMQELPGVEPRLMPDAMRDLLTSIMPPRNQEEFHLRHDTDFAYEIPNLARFRANVFMDRKGMGGVFRIIPSDILTAEQLGLSDAIMNMCKLSKGLVVVTGPTGSGKSTTLCAMVDSINRSREDHIITIEDPIEFVHENKKCLVNQREVGNHTDSFKDALRAALREDPDILLVGEMRDLETISIAIETAETGHLVFGTLHTTTAASTVDRIIDQFPADRQQQIRVMLSESLKGVIAQTLLPKKGGGRVAALEILVVTPAISNLIREGKTFQIPSAMQTGKNHGMVMLNDALLMLVQKGIVEPKDAYLKAVDKNGFESALNRVGMRI